MSSPRFQVGEKALWNDFGMYWDMTSHIYVVKILRLDPLYSSSDDDCEYQVEVLSGKSRGNPWVTSQELIKLTKLAELIYG